MVQQRESRYINEWLAVNHPEALTWKRVRLGPLPKKGMAGLLGVTQKWVDAIFYEDGIVHLLEAKLKRDIGVISQIKLYRSLFSETPEFSQLRDRQIKLLLLIPWVDIDIARMAAEENIEVHIYKPEWLIEELIRK